jgi:hypothetical protein
MTELTFLHEPGVLANLQRRYSSAAIYTYTGSILIAVNPFQPLPDLYSRAVMDTYAGGASEGRPPHVYAIASAAYRKMRSEGKGQAILVRLVVAAVLCWGGSGVVGSCQLPGVSSGWSGRRSHCLPAPSSSSSSSGDGRVWCWQD